MKELITYMPQIFTYFTLGYIFLHIFRYANTIKNSEEYEHVIFESLLVGYIIDAVWEVISLGKIQLLNNTAVKYLIMLIGTIIISFIFGKIYSLKCWDNFMNHIGIHRTRKSYMMGDMLDTKGGTFLDLRNMQTKERYFGEIFICEEYTNTPKVVLIHYKYWRDYEDDDLIEDYTADNHIAVMLDVSKFESVIFQYESTSDVLKR